MPLSFHSHENRCDYFDFHISNKRQMCKSSKKMKQLH